MIEVNDVCGDLHALYMDMEADHLALCSTYEVFFARFAGSTFVIYAKEGERIVGFARILSDGVQFAYLPEIWVVPDKRKQGVGTQIMREVIARLPKYHVYIFASRAQEFYAKLGFYPQGVGMGRIL